MGIDEYMLGCESKPFKWGEFDCCLFAAGAIQAVAGFDCMEGMRDYYDEVTASVKLREEFGTASIREVFLKIADSFSAKLIDLENAKDGDLVCVQWPSSFEKANRIDQSCGMAVFYRNQVVACTVRGLVSVPPTHRIIDVWSFE